MFTCNVSRMLCPLIRLKLLGKGPALRLICRKGIRNVGELSEWVAPTISWPPRIATLLGDHLLSFP